MTQATLGAIIKVSEGEEPTGTAPRKKKMVDTTPWVIAAGLAYVAHHQQLASPDPLTRMAAGNGLAVAREWLSEARDSVLALEACYALPSD